MPPCSNVLIRRRIESPRRALLPLIGWASCFKSTYSTCSLLPARRTRRRRLRFLSPHLSRPTCHPSLSLSPSLHLQLCHLHAAARQFAWCLCLSCFAAIPARSTSVSLSTQWRVKSVNRRRRQSVLQVSATTARPAPAAALPTSSATPLLGQLPSACAGNVLNRKALFQLC